ASGISSASASGSSAVRSAMSEAASLAASTEIASALRTEEVVRTIALLRLVAPVCALGLAAVAATRPDNIRRVPTAIGIGTTLAFTLGLRFWLRNPSRFRPSLALVHGLLCAGSILVGIIYFGVFSPTIMACCVGIYFFGLSDSRKNAWAIYLLC